MRSSLHACFLLLGVTALVLASPGCGGSDPMDARPEVAAAAAAPEETLGSTVKAQIYEFRAKVRKRGGAAVKAEQQILLENLAGIDTKPAAGAHAATYKEILEKVKGMSESQNKDALTKTANELGTLADKLPGKANNNPIVD